MVLLMLSENEILAHQTLLFPQTTCALHRAKHQDMFKQLLRTLGRQKSV